MLVFPRKQGVTYANYFFVYPILWETQEKNLQMSAAIQIQQEKA